MENIIEERRRYNSTNDRRLFYRNHPTEKFKKGSTILLQGATPKHVYGVKSGIVEESNLTDKGNRQSISFNVAGDIIPKCWVFSKTDKTLFDYLAFTDCELYVIDKSTFQMQYTQNIYFANQMIGRLMDLLVGARLQIDALEKPHAHEKLLYVLRYFCLIYGRKLENNLVKIQIPLTQQNLADLTGLTRETISIELNSLKNAKMMSISKKYYTVDVKKLDSAIDDEYDPGISIDILGRGF